MAAFNFPNSPSTNDLHTENGVTFKWNGTMWLRVGPAYTDTTNLNVTGIGTFDGNVSIGGTLTYEDVKNVDSVGVITARSNLYVGSGITCYASSGIVSATSFSSGPISLLDVDTGGRVKTTSGWLTLQSASGTVIEELDGTNQIKTIDNGAVELYHAGTKKAETTAAGVTVSGTIIDDKDNVRRIPQNNQTSAYTIVSADAGKHINISTGGVTFAANLFIAGDAVTIINDSGSNQTITCGAVTMYLAGDTSTKNSLTLAGRGMASFICMGGNVFYGSGGGLS